MKMKIRAAAIVIGLAALMPAAGNAATIIGAAQQAGDFTMLLKAGKAAGVDKALEGKGPFTLFAPNDAAFAKVPKAKLDDLMKPANLEMLKTTLGSHLATGILSMQAIEAGLANNGAVVVTTVNNMPLIFKREGGAMTVNGAKLIKPPMRVDNGLVYVIDTVLVPPMPLQPVY
ncbi:MAG: fasciclin domain-containing protein [Pseudolabrys sp.]